MARGAAAYKMMVQQARAASRYRKARADLRRGLRVGRHGETTGQVETCAVCTGDFDVNGLIRDQDCWTCEACVFAVEADQMLTRAHDHTTSAVGVLLVLMALVVAELWASQGYAPWATTVWKSGGWVSWTGLSSSIVLCAGVLVGAWSSGLRRSGVGTVGLVALEALGFLTAAVFAVRAFVALGGPEVLWMGWFLVSSVL